jgi:hypothetical protein
MLCLTELPNLCGATVKVWAHSLRIHGLTIYRGKHLGPVTQKNNIMSVKSVGPYNITKECVVLKSYLLGPLLGYQDEGG